MSLVIKLSTGLDTCSLGHVPRCLRRITCKGNCKCLLLSLTVSVSQSVCMCRSSSVFSRMPAIVCIVGCKIHFCVIFVYCFGGLFMWLRKCEMQAGCLCLESRKSMSLWCLVKFQKKKKKKKNRREEIAAGEFYV